jgi:hypothetical protein
VGAYVLPPPTLALSSDNFGGYVTPVRRSGRFGVDADGGKMTDEDSMQKGDAL